MAEIPETVIECDGCEKELNVLSSHLHVMLKPKRGVLVAEEVAAEGDEIPEQQLNLGFRSGRGRIWRFHNFDCFLTKLKSFKGKESVLEVHKEDEIYVPEDNRSPEELVATGEMSKETLAALDLAPAERGEQ